MTTLTIEIPPDVYQRLEETAQHQRKPIAELAQEWLAERIAVQAYTERQLLIEALRTAGLFAEPSEAMRRHAAQATMTLEEVSAALDRVGGKPLSEVILDDRGPKG